MSASGLGKGGTAGCSLSDFFAGGEPGRVRSSLSNTFEVVMPAKVGCSLSDFPVGGGPGNVAGDLFLSALCLSIEAQGDIDVN